MLMTDSVSLRILTANPALQMLTGYSLRELRMLTYTQLVMLPPEEIFKNRDQLLGQSVMEAGPAKIRAKDGTAIDMERSLSLVKFDGQSAICVVIRDIRQRLRLEEECLQAQKMEALGRLAGGVAHDCNNLLTIIQGQLELVFQDPLLAPSCISRLHMIREAAQQSAKLTHQLLTLGRKREPILQVQDLRAIVRDFTLMAQTIAGQLVDFQVELDPRPCLARVEAFEIGQVIMNLVANARDAMPRGGGLKLAVAHCELSAPLEAFSLRLPPGAYCVLSARDTGVGIAAEIQSHIFDPYFTTKGEHGTGLGLSIVYAIARQSGGAVRVESRPGRGSAFEIYLPAVPPESVNGQGGQ